LIKTWNNRKDVSWIQNSLEITVEKDEDGNAFFTGKVIGFG